MVDYLFLVPPKKPYKRGMKAWVLTDAKSDYMWNWDIYIGKSEY